MPQHQEYKTVSEMIFKLTACEQCCDTFIVFKNVFYFTPGKEKVIILIWFTNI